MFECLWVFNLWPMAQWRTESSVKERDNFATYFTFITYYNPTNWCGSLVQCSCSVCLHNEQLNTFLHRTCVIIRSKAMKLNSLLVSKPLIPLNYVTAHQQLLFSYRCYWFQILQVSHKCMCTVVHMWEGRHDLCGWQWSEFHSKPGGLPIHIKFQFLHNGYQTLCDIYLYWSLLIKQNK